MVITTTEAKLDVIRVREDGGNVYEAIVNSSFDQLVQAMATFGASSSGVPTGVTQDVEDIHSNNLLWVAA